MKYAKPIQKALAFNDKLASLGIDTNKDVEFKVMENGSPKEIGSLIAIIKKGRLKNTDTIFNFFGLVASSNDDFIKSWEEAKKEFASLTEDKKEAFVKNNRSFYIPSIDGSFDIQNLAAILAMNNIKIPRALN